MQLLYFVMCAALAAALPQRGKLTNYNESIARKLLNMAAGAYGDKKDECINRTYSASEGYRVLSSIKENCDYLGNTCKGYIAVSDVTKELLIAFRGTDNMPQLVVQGFKAILPLENFLDMGSVNEYFLNAHDALWPPIERTMNDANYKEYRITLTGHSLGGALAALAAARIANQGFRSGDQITMYTFGEPRVGDLTFATNFDSMIKNSYRVVFGRDSIPHLPPCKKDPSWSGEEGDSRPCDANAKGTPYHHSTEIWYPDSMEPGSHYDECLGQPIGEDFTCSNKFAFSSHPEQIESYILDHAHYFTVPVPQYGEVGCDHTQAGSLSLFDYIPDNLINFLRF
ncbi:hypothetical protein Q1695_003901 [Nippostrongylus brasiliensis]|nr:hypothetical protein Q1695_003901 [Nippostrongylus brasiliensis]